jgi:hypothetical protein
VSQKIDTLTSYYGVIDETGKLIVPCEYDKIEKDEYGYIHTHRKINDILKVE